jgi:O-antigen/teichoic acid export membrane protein
MAPILTNGTHKTAKESSSSVAAESQNFFNTEHLKSDLKGRSVRGGAVTMTAQVAQFLLQTGSTVVLARLLTPHDYGLIAMVTAITAFAALFKNMGLSAATIQRAEINHHQISTLFWINVAVGFVLASILAGVAPIISWFYGEPRLTNITFVLASTFIFSGLTVQHDALLRRQMRFSAIAVIETGSMVIGIIIAIVLAWYGMRHWALVGLSVGTAICNAVLVWVFCGWRPCLPIRRAGVRSMLAFGGHITGFNIANYFSRNLDNVLIGRYFGSGVLGLYSRAYSIMMLPIDQIRVPLQSVATPALCHIQNDFVRYQKYYTKLISLIAFITMPLIVFLFVCGDQTVHLLLGNQWSGAAGIFKILAIAAFIQPVISPAGLVLVSLGQSKRYLKWGVFNSIITVASFIVGLPWGAVGVALSYAIVNYLLFFPCLWYCFRRSPMSIAAFMQAILRPMTASLCMGAAIFPAYLFLQNQSDIMVIGTCFVLGLSAYLLVWVLIPGGIQTLREFRSYGPVVFGKKIRP